MHNVFPPGSPAADQITFDEFLKVDIRIGTVKEVEEYPEARNPSYKLKIDFGEGVGVRKSIAQLTDLYRPEDLVGRQVAAVVNFPPRQIAKATSEVLVLGFPNSEGRIVLFSPDSTVPDGARLV
ncbi:MAG: tRNA-binding protein [Candidatus Eremiobacteraeota bacterium]|nr:tRNA-binding protein [Candidatus Eremiobacteraeota bacterium]